MSNVKRAGVVLLISALGGFGAARVNAQNCSPGTIPVWVQQGNTVHLGCSTAPLGMLKPFSRSIQKMTVKQYKFQTALDKANSTIQALQKQASTQQAAQNQQNQLNAANQATILVLRAQVNGLQSAFTALAQQQSPTTGQGLVGPKGYASGYLAMWSGPSAKLVNSVMQQDKNGALAVGTAPGSAATLQVSSTGATAVLGTNSGGGRGVEGDSISKGGVVGQSDNANGVTGVTKSQTAGAVVGVGHRAALFQGNVGVTGIFAVQGYKKFKIDDPLDPASKYLSHVSVESSKATDFYNGEAVLDRAGEAVVQLPDWFEALNKDFCYQLTAVGTAAPNLYIAEKISHNTFKIAGGKPGLEVSWQVTGVRNDAWAKAHPLKVEEEKPLREQGTYISPELFGQPEEKGLAWLELPDFRNELLALRAITDRQLLLAKAQKKSNANGPTKSAIKSITGTEDNAGAPVGGSPSTRKGHASHVPPLLK